MKSVSWAPAFAQWKHAEASPVRRYAWYVETMLAERIAAKRFRALVRKEQAAMGSHASAPAAALASAEAVTDVERRQA